MNKLTEGENPKDGGLKDGGLKDGGLKDGGLKDGMLRLLFVDTGRTRKNKAAPDRVHTAMLDTRLVIIHPQESALDVLLERIAVAFSHNEGSPMDRIQSGWVHSRGSGDRFSVRILGVSENMADIVRAQAAAEKWPTLLWNRQTDDITLPDGVSLGAANAGDASQTGVSLPSRVFFAPAPERTGCSTAPSAIPEGFLLASVKALSTKVESFRFHHASSQAA